MSDHLMGQKSIDDPDALANLCATAQFNADLADAQHAQSSPLCIYLLNMRDFFRWERKVPFDQTLERSELGPWIRTREAHWDALRDGAITEDQTVEYRPLFPGVSDDPFNTLAIHDVLESKGLVYGAGIGRFGRPQFFLGRAIAREIRSDCEIVVCGEEFSRGASAAPAMSRGHEILIRQDALERWLWARYEEWQLHPRDNGLSVAYASYADRIVAEYGHAIDPPVVIRQMALHERETLILHELGERRIDADLGEDWHEMLDDMPSRKAELLARSIRDLLADCTVTLPRLLASDSFASIHCWFGLLDGVRLKLSPALLEAYQHWRTLPEGSRLAGLEAARQHYAVAAERLLTAWRRDGAQGVENLVDDPSLVF